MFYKIREITMVTILLENVLFDFSSKKLSNNNCFVLFWYKVLRFDDIFHVKNCTFFVGKIRQISMVQAFFENVVIWRFFLMYVKIVFSMSDVC